MDATGLYAIADRLDGQAELVRARGQLLAMHRDRLRWHSPAARHWRAEMDIIVTDMLAWSARAGVLADEVRAHAARVLQAR